jgi:BirA family biotin operon repressor/biotin-[acetyl-CoA-carboxylase] ligase
MNMINMRTALVIREILGTRLTEREAPFNHSILVKWPNDILVEEKKISGILLESEILDREVKFLILGIGINVNHQQHDFPDELQKRATSLQLLTGQNWESSQLLNKLLPHLQQQFILDQQNDYNKVITEYQKFLAFKDQIVEVMLQDQTIRGRLRGIDSHGYLQLEQGNEIQTITTGDLWI